MVEEKEKKEKAPVEEKASVEKPAEVKTEEKKEEVVEEELVIETTAEDPVEEKVEEKVKDNRKQRREIGASDLDNWKPRTDLGRRVFEGKITNIDEIIDSGTIILEPEIVDTLLTLESDLILIGQSKGKFGGGQRRVFKQTQKKTKEGNKPQFTTLAVVGDRNGHLGIGTGKAKETVPAREKAIRKAKMNIFKIRRGCGSWEGTDGPNSIPFAVQGKCGSVKVKLMPAPIGKGLVCEKEVAKVLGLAGIQDVLSRTFGHSENKINLIKALEAALRQLSLTKLHAKANQNVKIYEGSVNDGEA